MFDQHLSFLEERMDPDSGLLDKLLANKTLSRIECNDIKDHHPFERRNARLLEFIDQKKKYSRLIGALRDNRQTHLVNYLIGNGEHYSECGDDWPLTDNELSILDINQESLVDLLDCSDLLIRLFSAQVINGRQRETISSEPTNHRRNEVLLDIIRRRSIDDYRQVVRCLHESNQSHVADILNKGGVVVRVHADLGNDKDADRAEDDIIARFTDILSNKPLDEANRILTEIELKIIAAKKGHSVILYVYCRTAKELMDLYEMDMIGKLRSIVKQVFKQLVCASSTEVTIANHEYATQMKRLTVTLPEYKKFRSYLSDECHIIRAVYDFDHEELTTDEDRYLDFKKGDYMMTTAAENIGDTSDWWKVQHLRGGEIGYIPRKYVVINYGKKLREKIRSFNLLKRPTTTSSSRTKINLLPLELLDIILQKSLLHCLLNKDRLKDQSDHFLITQLTTVDHCWSKRMNKGRFKRAIWRSLLAINKSIVILRSNQSFLMETMRLREGLIDQLRLCDCLTDIQSRLLNRQTFTSEKRKLLRRNNSSDMLHAIRSCDDTRRSDCFRCIRQSSQKFVTKVIENGGVVIKVNLSSRDAGDLQQLSDKMNHLYDKDKLRIEAQETSMNQLVDSDIEIFHSHMDRQAVIYSWCKSQTGLKHFRTLYESKSIVDVIDNLTKNTLSEHELIGSRMIDVDSDQFKKIIVVYPIVVRFTAQLDVNDGEQATGVTMLGKEICVLCVSFSSLPHSIRVFENRNPFSLNAKIDIGEFIEEPADIGSSDKENCLFVIDSEEECVWKITRQTGDGHKFLRLRSTTFPHPAVLSVSSDGQKILILTPHSLDIYNAFESESADQKSPLSIQLPSDIEKPHHAVETSRGHFIILHSLKQDSCDTTELKMKKKQMCVVSKVIRNGRLVRRFAPQNATEALSFPCYLALDSEDRVFVADGLGHQVSLLDSDLSWIQNLGSTKHEDEQQRRPHRLCYDKVERLLVVVGHSSQFKADVYTIESTSL